MQPQPPIHYEEPSPLETATVRADGGDQVHAVAEPSGTIRLEFQLDEFGDFFLTFDESGEHVLETRARTELSTSNARRLAYELMRLSEESDREHAAGALYRLPCESADEELDEPFAAGGARV